MAEKQKKVRSRQSRIITSLRREWVKSPERNAVKKRCTHPEHKHIFICEKCGSQREKIYMDHIDPVVNPAEGFVDWNEFIKKLYVTPDKLQGLCFDCHAKKTKEENVIRRQIQKAQRDGLKKPKIKKSKNRKEKA